MRITLDILRDKTDDLQNAQAIFLKERGWKSSCSHPDSCWRWEKKIKGKLYVMEHSEALSLETFMEEMRQDRLEPDQLGPAFHTPGMSVPCSKGHQRG
jgi:hypothetical protein